MTMSKIMTGVYYYTFLEAIEGELVLLRYPNQNGRWSASISGAEIKKGSILSGDFGNGTTPEEAIKDYLEKIEGKLLVLGAYTDNRREYNVPENLLY